MKSPDVNARPPSSFDEGQGPPVPLPILDDAEAQRAGRLAPLTAAEMIARLETATVGLDARARGLAIDMLLSEPSMVRGMAGEGGEGVRAWLGEAGGGRLDAATPPAEPARRKSLAQAYDAAAAVMMSRARGVVRPIPTPWEGFNRRLRGGLWPGLAVLTSNTGSGKTQFAVQLVISAARHFREEQIRTGAEHADRALYIALELGEVDLTARVVGLLSGARWSDLYHGDYDPEGLCRPGESPDPNHLALLFENHRPTVADLPIDVDTADAMRWTWQDLQKVGDEPRPPRLIVLDYTQLARAPADGPREELRQTIAASALVGRDLARRHGIAVLAISSTARSNYGKVSGKGERGKPGERVFPVIPGENDSDVDEYIDIGKDAGELEYTADVSFALVRDPEPLQEQSLNGRRAPSMVWPAIAKGRGIGAGWAPPVMFDGHCFTEATPAQITARNGRLGDWRDAKGNMAPAGKPDGEGGSNGGRRPLYKRLPGGGEGPEVDIGGYEDV